MVDGSTSQQLNKRLLESEQEVEEVRRGRRRGEGGEGEEGGEGSEGNIHWSSEQGRDDTANVP